MFSEKYLKNDEMIKGPTTKLFAILILMCFGCSRSNVPDKNWTHFRGSNLNGIALTKRIPLKWDDSTIKWKTEIHDRGHSSPVVFDDQIWLTTASRDGKDLYAICVDYETGKVLFDIKVFSSEESIGKHGINTYASPTPCIEKGFVYVHFGSLGTACLNTSDGSIIWERTDLKCNHVQGPGSSPVLYQNVLILHYEGTDVRYIVGLDKATGKEIWRTYRPDEPYEPLPQIGKKAYVTPLIMNVSGRDLLISNGSAVCCAYEPLTGKEVWKVVRGAESTVPMPFAENGIVYFYTGSMEDPPPTYSEMLAVNPEGTGDITETNIIWTRRDDIAHTQILTPLIKDGLIYTVSSKNMLMCLDASNGKEIWSQRMSADHNASPVYVDGNVWFFSVKGDVLAVKAGRYNNVITQNKMDSGIWATPAFIRNSVILRTEKYLYKISG
jgi:outer membrane protein assembly factor BamB